MRRTRRRLRGRWLTPPRARLQRSSQRRSLGPHARLMRLPTMRHAATPSAHGRPPLPTDVAAADQPDQPDAPGVAVPQRTRREIWHPRLQRVGRLTWRDTTRSVLAGYGRHGGDGLATMIAFNATVSLVPFLLTLFTLLSLLVQSTAVHTRLREGVADLLPIASADVVLRIVDQGRSNLSQLSLVTIVALFLGGSRFLTALDGAFSRIYGVQQRPWVERKIVFTLVVPLVALLLIGAASAATVANLLLAQPDRMLASAERQWWSGTLSLFGSFLAAYVLLWVIYATIPNYHAYQDGPNRRFRAWPGALVSAILFVVLTQLFPIYLQVFGGSIQVAGALALALLLLLWMYSLGQVLVVGAEVNALASRAPSAVARVPGMTKPHPRGSKAPAPAPAPATVVDVAVAAPDVTEVRGTVTDITQQHAAGPATDLQQSASATAAAAASTPAPPATPAPREHPPG